MGYIDTSLQVDASQIRSCDISYARFVVATRVPKVDAAYTRMEQHQFSTSQHMIAMCYTFACCIKWSCLHKVGVVQNVIWGDSERGTDDECPLRACVGCAWSFHACESFAR